MFFGKGDTLEQWLRKRDRKGFEGWDGHAMRVFAVQTKGQQQQQMICVTLVNEDNVIHRVYVTAPNSTKLVKGGPELLDKFQSEYLPEGRRETLTEIEAGPTLVPDEAEQEAS